MNCPICKIQLRRTPYEGVVVLVCGQCKGVLAKMNRLKAIQTKRLNSQDELAEEMNQGVNDTAIGIHCSGCTRKMEKQSKRIGSSKFAIDRCEKCRLVWLDNGELAKMQVLYEFSEQGQEAQRFKDRLNNMTPEEKKQLDERIAKLPEENVAVDIVAGVMDIATSSGRSRRRRRTNWFDVLDWFE